ncbi:putative methyltransferase [Rhizomicrobium palustre]|uniref:Putative methyltransferase n=1 Tax=Rhizomicrobium palustre TaxID=189966 RepID=A0A846MV17_9PROT|nr:class I SAM-dependent methyltransferase [Rhizomicrobium palustre]NIK87294.1 putative methyltransferase [Rhizomicrobium palustre]
MKKMLSAVLLSGAVLSMAALAAKPAAITTALSDTARPADDVKRDGDRKPAEMLEFSKIKPGAKVMDLVPGGGYFTRIFAKAVGPEGWVYAYQPSELDSFSKGKSPKILAVAKEYPNVSVIHAPINDLSAPEALDVVFTAQNYHDMKDDFFKPADTDKVNKAVFKALKPGGLYIVIDHAAEKGSGLRDTNTLHRIDEAAVKQEITAAGFEFAGESKVLRNTKDPKTANVFDPSIRGKTDQFVYKFRKPLKAK